MPEPPPAQQVMAMTKRLVKMQQEVTELADLCHNHLLWVEDRLKDMKKSPSKNLLWRIANTITLLETVRARGKLERQAVRERSGNIRATKRIPNTG
jgi:hypothetical protein